jgi:hypothetical protein
MVKGTIHLPNFSEIFFSFTDIIIYFSGVKSYKSKPRTETTTAVATAIELNDCLLESENIQITKKDDKYLLQPIKSESKQASVKFVLQECGKIS